MSLVSVIIPTYNRPEMLRLTLESIHNQTFSDFEVLVIDDGTPNSLNEELCREFPKVQYFKIENSGGPSRPRNMGIQRAKGKYVTFLDDDDLWLPQKLEKQAAVLEDNSEFGIVHTPCKVINAYGEETSETIGQPRAKNLKHGDVSMRMIGDWTLMTSSVMIRKTILDKVGFFKEDMPQAGEDTQFWTRCSFYTKFYYLDEPLVLYRRHEGISSQLRQKYFELPFYLNEVLEDMLSKNRIDTRQYKKLQHKVIKRQIKELPKGKLKTFKRLFKLNPFWFLNFGNVKLFIKLVLR